MTKTITINSINTDPQHNTNRADECGFFTPTNSQNGEKTRIAQPELWQAINNYSPGYSDAQLSFRQRLAHENDWSDIAAYRVIREYKRFLYLAATMDHSVSPSDAVDRAWHLHLTYTREYWEVFCPTVLGKPLHHNPTRGGAEELNKHLDWYTRTLDDYRSIFGEPPSDIWPAPEKRFVERPKKPADKPLIERTMFWVKLFVIVILAYLIFWLGVKILHALALLVFLTVWIFGGDGGSGDGSGSGDDDCDDSGCGSGCGGGCGGCG